MGDPDPRQAARALRELIEAEAEAVEQRSTLTPPVVEALERAGLFRLLVPRDLGGHEAEPAEIVDVCEELSFADGSVGWAFAQNTTVMAYSAYLARDFAEPLARARAGAGMFAPLGAAVPEKGGFRISGRYPFGSGSGHADYMGGSALLMQDGEPAPFEGGLPQILAFVLPADRVRIEENWDVMGLRGTGSFDFEVPEQHVETGRTFSLFATRAVTGGALYGLGPVTLGTISSVAWGLGVAGRALEEIAEIAKAGRTRLGSAPLRDQPGFQQELGSHRIAVQAARLLAKSSYSEAVSAIADGAADERCAARLRETRAAASHVIQVAKQAVHFAYEAAGSHAMRNPSRLQRCFRDMVVGAQHQVFDSRNYQELAKPALGLEPAPF